MKLRRNNHIGLHNPPLGMYEVVAGRSPTLPVGTVVAIITHAVEGKKILNMTTYQSHYLNRVSQSVRIKPLPDQWPLTYIKPPQ